jgi:hypothetical protein
MNKQLYSNKEFIELRNRINTEIKRRATYTWWDPLYPPNVGMDRSSPIILPDLGDGSTELANKIVWDVSDNDDHIIITGTLPNDVLELDINDKLQINGTTSNGKIIKWDVNNTEIDSVTIAGTAIKESDIDGDPNINIRMVLTNKTYTIDNPSEGSIEPTRNINFPDHSDNPAGPAETRSIVRPNTSAARFDADEARNFLVGMSKIKDINLFYGRDEDGDLAFRDPTGIENVVKDAEKSQMNDLLHLSDIPANKNDPNGGLQDRLNPNYPVDKDITYPSAIREKILFDVVPNKILIPDGIGRAIVRVLPPDGIYVMESGEWDGDEISQIEIKEKLIERIKFFMEAIGSTEVINYIEDHVSDLLISYRGGDTKATVDYASTITQDVLSGLSENHFYDDYGAPEGDGNFHPISSHSSELVDRSWLDEGEYRNKTTIKTEGGIPSSRFGTNPRNPNIGNQYRSRPVYGGKIGACNVACTGLCFKTCDNQCSESCTTTCWSRCGNACTATCGNVCTGCTTLCYTSCQTKCQNSTGYACLKSGAMTVKIVAIGKAIGKSDEWPANKISSSTYTCEGCSYTCQFYPNKKTTCWDSGCKGTCFTSCQTACSATCFGGCVDNPEEGGRYSDTGYNYKTGKGRACSFGCTRDCVGTCEGTCEGECVTGCHHACKTLCYDNCTWTCSTNCGAGCAQGCRNGCAKGCYEECKGTCSGKADMIHGCVGCGFEGGCMMACKHNCDHNCISWGCRSICGTGDAGACEANCRLSCMSASCSSMCSNQCASYCTSCVNGCDMNCGACTSQCSIGCGAACNITCTSECHHACVATCSMSCTDQCGGCSNLCYSCVGMCIGVCSVKCESTCSNCANKCSWWCDTSCNRQCFSSCDNRCIATCSGSCATFLESKTLTPLDGPERDPTAQGYIYPQPKNRWEERESFRFKYTSSESIPIPPPEPEKEYPISVWVDDDHFLHVDIIPEITWVMRSTTLVAGVWNVDQVTGEITINYDAIDAMPEDTKPNLDGGRGLFVIVLYKDPLYIIKPEDISIKLIFGYETIEVMDPYGNIIIIIQQDFIEEDELGQFGKP